MQCPSICDEGKPWISSQLEVSCCPDLNLQINNVTPVSSLHEALKKKFPTLFGGIGQLKDVTVKLHINTSIQPVAQQPRWASSLSCQTESERGIKNLVSKGIIEKVDGPTPRVSPLVVIPKTNSNVRICVDMRLVNKAIIQERHPMPTVDDLIHRLNGATVFSKLDLRAGYHQLTLDKESRYITTFATHKGLWRYKSLNFGTNSASESSRRRSKTNSKAYPEH